MNKINIKDNKAEEEYALKLIKMSRFEEAEEIYRGLVKKGSENHIVYGNLAVLTGINNKSDEKVYFLKKALDLKYDFPEAHLNLGIAYKEKGKLEEAIESYKYAIRFKPNYAEAYNNLGNLFNQKGEIDQAINYLNTAIKIKPNFAEAYNNLGNALKAKGQLDLAINSFNNAIKIKPSFAEAHNNLGNIMQTQNNDNKAIIMYRKALKLKPNYPTAENNLGAAYQNSGNIKLAKISYKRAITLLPNYAEAYNNLGTAYQEENDIKHAIECFNRAIQIKPNYEDPYINIGNTYKSKGELLKAKDYYEKALNINRNSADANCNLSHILLLQDEYKLGLEKSEWRFKKTKPIIPHAKPQTKYWTGQNIGINDKLHIVSEQGLGDTIQFMRYIPYLREIGFNISFCAPKKLHSLIQASKIIDEPLSPNECNCISDGIWMPLLSVPNFLQITPKNPIITNSYISTRKDLRDKWRKILSKENKPIVGINWQGNPKTERYSLKGRSFDLECYSTIAKKKDISLISLQKGYGSEQLNHCTFKDKFVKNQKEVDSIMDFLETAAIIENCNLIITSDTCIAHLAAGIGKPTWLLLQKIPDWRWGLNKTNTFWYESMRLFRQKDLGSWKGVFDQVLNELEYF